MASRKAKMKQTNRDGDPELRRCGRPRIVPQGRQAHIPPGLMDTGNETERSVVSVLVIQRFELLERLEPGEWMWVRPRGTAPPNGSGTKNRLKLGNSRMS